uniref:Nibrin n=1 Tax=Schistocephalus solidus TaxID=70667 RepID=A0A0X3NP52_SCHSO
MWILSKENDPNFKHALLTNRVYTVGRSDSDIIILDRSVSRHHATLRLTYLENNLDGDTLPDLSIVDLSKFGTSVNGKALNKSTLSLESGSKITFGALPGVTVTAEFQPLNVLLSLVPADLRTTVRSHLLSLGATMLNAWEPRCTLVVMPRLIVTHKVLCALLSGVSIVTPAYLESLINACGGQIFSTPSCADFLPQIEEKGFDGSDKAKFYPNGTRSKVFDGKTFYFMTQSKFQRYRQLLGLTTASMELLTSSTYSRLGDETQVRAALRNRLASTTACVLYESSATTFYNSDQSWHATVYTVLQELQLRPILEQEIAFAIIEASSASVCNPRILCCDLLLKQSQGIPEDYLSQFARFTVPSAIYSDIDCPSRCAVRPSLLQRKRLAGPLTSEQNNTENNELLEDPGSPRKRRRILQTGPISRLLPPDCPLNNALARGRSKILVPDTEALPASCTLVSDYADTVEDYPSPGRQIVGRPPKWSPGSSDLLEEEEPDRKPTSDNLSLGASIGRTSVTVSSPFSTTKQSIVTAGASPKEEFSENRVDQAFDSLPSLSTLIKWPTFKHPEEFPGSDASFGENANRTVNYRFSVQEPVLSNAEKENISPCPRTALSTAIVVNSSAQGHRVSECLVTGEFLSKEKGHRLIVEGLTSSARKQASSEATVESAVACAKVEFAALCTLRPTRIPKAVPASVYSDFKTVNFKRFRKIWPFTSGSPCRDIYAEVLTKQQPTRPRVALAPFVGGQREDSMAACRITAPKPLDAEDLVNQAKINHLFDQLCALPTLKRR